jgi:serine/threonine-protein kinase HipA
MLIRRRFGQANDNTGEQSFGEADYLLGVRDDLRQGAVRFREPDSSEFLAHVIDRKGRIAIAKFPKAEGDEWNVTGWEAVTLKLARNAGINAAASELTDVAGRSVHIVDRFDRQGDLRVGYVSAMTLLEAVDGEPRSYLDLVEVIEAQSDRVTADLHELWRRIAFSILVSNTDDHLRNHGFLRTTAGGWSLSPAFDINPNPEPGPKYLSTSIDGRSNLASIELLLEVAELFRLDHREAAAVLAEVTEATGRWQEVARRLGLDRSAIAEMRSAFDHVDFRPARSSGR